MTKTSTTALRDGVILNNRYRIIKQIARDSCGLAYLSEDVHRYRELYVLEEFAPWVTSDRELENAENLFEQKAGILHQIEHSQIPRWEKLLHTTINGQRSLFLVSEYVEGETYQQLLGRKGKLSEVEVVKMLWEVLSILDYIHAAKLFHGNITPENLILPNSDGKTVLTNFSCVKFVTNVIARATGGAVTRICDPDYYPDEQLRCGRASVSGDLYSLAATAVVLLTGKQPQELYNLNRGRWDWEEVKVSPGLRKILNKMLASKASDRYQSADRVRQMLSKAKNSVLNRLIPRLGLNHSHSKKSNAEARCPLSLYDRVHHGAARLNSSAENISRQLSTISPSANLNRIRPWQWGMITSAIILIPGLISFATIRTKMAVKVAIASNSAAVTTLNANELQSPQDIARRVENLELNAGAFYRQVDSIFYNRYPELEGTSLRENSQHQQYRQIWYKIASSLLDEREGKQ